MLAAELLNNHLLSFGEDDDFDDDEEDEDEDAEEYYANNRELSEQKAKADMELIGSIEKVFGQWKKMHSSKKAKETPVTSFLKKFYEVSILKDYFGLSSDAWEAERLYPSLMDESMPVTEPHRTVSRALYNNVDAILSRLKVICQALEDASNHTLLANTGPGAIFDLLQHCLYWLEVALVGAILRDEMSFALLRIQQSSLEDQSLDSLDGLFESFTKDGYGDMFQQLASAVNEDERSKTSSVSALFQFLQSPMNAEQSELVNRSLACKDIIDDLFRLMVGEWLQVRHSAIESISQKNVVGGFSPIFVPPC
jgi:hypothetical protein